jgi:hypothetical protein
MPQEIAPTDGEEVAAQASWVFSILPYIEQNGLFENLKTGQVATGTVIPAIALLQCPSHTEGIRSRATNYVINGGTVDNYAVGEFTPDGSVANGPFLDRCSIIADRVRKDCLCGNSRCRYSANVEKFRKAVAKLSDISKMDGTSYTLMTAENVQRGYWISAEEIIHFYHEPNRDPISALNTSMLLPDGRITVSLTMPDIRSVHTIEGSVAFCWPRYGNNPRNPCQIAYPDNGAGAQYKGFQSDPPGAVQGDSERVPYFMNRNRNAEPSFESWYQSARPSSQHPSGFLVSFCDASVKRINDGMDEAVFVQLMTAGTAQSDAGQNFLRGKLLNTGSTFE